MLQGQMTRSLLIPAMTALAGLAFLVALTLQPLPGAISHGLLFPPWVSKVEAFRRASAFELPITDVRLRGRLIVLHAAAPLDTFARGALVINPRAAALCTISLRPEDPVS